MFRKRLHSARSSSNTSSNGGATATEIEQTNATLERAQPTQSLQVETRRPHQSVHSSSPILSQTGTLTTTITATQQRKRKFAGQSNKEQSGTNRLSDSDVDSEVEHSRGQRDAEEDDSSEAANESGAVPMQTADEEPSNGTITVSIDPSRIPRSKRRKRITSAATELAIASQSSLLLQTAADDANGADDVPPTRMTRRKAQEIATMRIEVPTSSIADLPPPMSDDPTAKRISPRLNELMCEENLDDEVQITSASSRTAAAATTTTARRNQKSKSTTTKPQAVKKNASNASGSSSSSSQLPVYRQTSLTDFHSPVYPTPVLASDSGELLTDNSPSVGPNSNGKVSAASGASKPVVAASNATVPSRKQPVAATAAVTAATATAASTTRISAPSTSAEWWLWENRSEGRSDAGKSQLSTPASKTASHRESTSKQGQQKQAPHKSNRSVASHTSSKQSKSTKNQSIAAKRDSPIPEEDDEHDDAPAATSNSQVPHRRKTETISRRIHLRAQEEEDDYDSDLESTPQIRATNSKYEWDTDPDGSSSAESEEEEEEEEASPESVEDEDASLMDLSDDDEDYNDEDDDEEEQQDEDSEDDEDDSSWGESSSSSESASSASASSAEEPATSKSKTARETTKQQLSASSSSGASSRSSKPTTATDKQEELPKPRSFGFGFGARTTKAAVATKKETQPTSSKASADKSRVSRSTASSTASSYMPPHAPMKRKVDRRAAALGIVPRSPFPQQLPVLFNHEPAHEPTPYPSHPIECVDSHSSDAEAAIVTSAAAAAAPSNNSSDPYSILDPSLPLSSLFELARDIPYNFSSVHSSSKGWSFHQYSRYQGLVNRNRTRVQQATEKREQAQLMAEMIEKELSKKKKSKKNDSAVTASQEASSTTLLQSKRVRASPPEKEDRIEKTYHDLFREAQATALPHIDPHIRAAALRAGIKVPEASVCPLQRSFEREWVNLTPSELSRVQGVYEKYGMERGSVPLSELDLQTPSGLEMRAIKYARAHSLEIMNLVPTKSTLLRRSSSQRTVDLHQQQDTQLFLLMDDVSLACVFQMLDLQGVLTFRSTCKKLHDLSMNETVSDLVWSNQLILFHSMTTLTGWAKQALMVAQPEADGDEDVDMTPADSEAHAFEEAETWYNKANDNTEAVVLKSSSTSSSSSSSSLSQYRWLKVHNGFHASSIPFIGHLRFEEDVLFSPSTWTRFIHPFAKTLHTLEIYNNLSLLTDTLLGVMLTGLEAMTRQEQAELSRQHQEQQEEGHPQQMIPALWKWPFNTRKIKVALPSLTSLTLYNCINFDLDGGLLFLPFYKDQLRYLHLSKCRGVGNGYLAQLAFNQAWNYDVPVEEQSSEALALQSLLGSCYWIRELSLNGCRELLPLHVTLLCPLAQLEILDLSWCINIDNECLQYLFTHNKHLHRSLRKLYLQGCTGVTDQAFVGMERLQALQVLDISQIPQLSNHTIQHVSQLPQLERLYLRFLNRLTDSVSRSIVRCQTLTYVDINFCSNISVHAKIAMKNKKRGMPLHFLTI